MRFVRCKAIRNRLITLGEMVLEKTSNYLFKEHHKPKFIFLKLYKSSLLRNE